MRTKWEENGENTSGMENVKSPLCNFMCAHYVFLICNNFSLISSTVSRAATKLTLIVNLSPDQCLNVINISKCVFFLLLFVRMKWEISKNIHLLYVELLCIIYSSLRDEHEHILEDFSSFDGEKQAPDFPGGQIGMMMRKMKKVFIEKWKIFFSTTIEMM